MAVTTEIALGVSTPMIDAEELLELPTLILELLLPAPLAAELVESALLEPLQPLSAIAMAIDKPQHRVRVMRPKGRRRGVMRSLH